MNTSVPVHIMTASLTPGDAISNYIRTLRTILRSLGCSVFVYADEVAPEFGYIARPSSDYAPRGGILWYHYSIYSENVSLIQQPIDFRIMDYHGVTPPHLFAGYDDRLADMCRRARHMLPQLRATFDLAVVHSDYTRKELQGAGYDKIEKIPLVVDTTQLDVEANEYLSSWLEHLDYLLFVGRVVPQKDILGMLEIFVHLRDLRPDAALIVAGGRQLAPEYQQRIDETIDRLNLAGRVILTGHITNRHILKSLYQQAGFTIITSEWETFCVPIVESMYFGTPVIAHNIPPLPEVVDDGGVIVDKNSPEEVARRIATLWSNDADYEALAIRARQRATSSFVESKLAPHIHRILGQLIA